MAEERVLVRLHDTFYRDSFGKVIAIITSIVIAILILVALSIYLFLNKPPPIAFLVEEEFRVLKPVPIDQPYLATADVLQWVATALTKSFVFDFIHYNDQLKSATKYYTTEGWQVFLNQVNNYANQASLITNKQFVSGYPSGAPSVLNQGLLSGRYAWWVQIPFTLNYASYNRTYTQTMTLQVLVVRVPTLNNLNGIGIDNILVAKGGNQVGRQ